MADKRAEPYWIPYVSRRKFDNSEGVNESHTIKTRAIGKGNQGNFSYLIANEWISASIANFLGLPVPPFGLMRLNDPRTAMFASVSFETRIPTEHSEPTILWKKHPELCTGILAFDILVGNCDRHTGNIKVNSKANPTRVHLFDHDRTLFYVYPGKGIKRLHDLADRIGVSEGSVSHGNRHCLIDVINSADHFRFWLDRIDAMPRTFTETICWKVWGTGTTKAEIEAVVNFLDDRRRRLDELIFTHKAEFTGIKTWPLVL
jgi:hypothetical protein